MTTSMHEQIRTELLQQVDILLGQREPNAARAEQLRAFTREFYRDVEAADLNADNPNQLRGVANALFEFLEVRQPGELKIRAFNPDTQLHGFTSPHTVIELINDDMPFLVDSVTAELTRLDTEVRLLIHPILAVERDAEGVLRAVSNTSGPKGSESVIHIRVRAQHAVKLPQLVSAMRRVLSDVRAAVEDFPEMRERCARAYRQLDERRTVLPPSSALFGETRRTVEPPSEPPASQKRIEEDRREVVAFLKWLSEDDFAFFGYRYSSAASPASAAPLSIVPSQTMGLGILRDPVRSVFEGIDTPATPQLLQVFKASERSTIHRPVHMDVVLLADISPESEFRGFHIFVGLFTLSAYSRSPVNVPLLRHKVRRVLQRSQFAEGSQNHKALKFVLETYPRDELFQITEQTLWEITSRIIHLEYRPRVALFSRHDSFGRFVSCLVYIPRDRFDTKLRLRLQEILTTGYQGSLIAYYPSLGDAPLARLHLLVRTPNETVDVDEHALEQRLLEATHSWQDRLRSALDSAEGEEQGAILAGQYADAFGAAYRETFDEHTAVEDIRFAQTSRQTGQVGMRLFRPEGCNEHELHFKMFSRHYVPLSDVLPMLENMGLKVLGEVPYEIHPRGPSKETTHARSSDTPSSETASPDSTNSASSDTGSSSDTAAKSVWMHDFSLVTEHRVPIRLEAVADSFIEVFGLVWRGEMDSDGFNKLVLHAGLVATQIKAIRGYARYLRQCGLPYSLDYIQQTLQENPTIASSLMALFAERFAPDRATGAPRAPHDSREAWAELAGQVRKQLDTVQSLDKDRILRALLNAICATTRTNFYQLEDNGQPKAHLAFKFDCQQLDELPLPKPEREIFVFGPRVEGVHLRYGSVARGGLRWSDRLEDYRTEILGLVKAQQVKNAVIVPVGSKGGFVVRRPPAAAAGRQAFFEEGMACYRCFISALLDVTDDLVGTEVVAPERVRRHDADDPYLVVAADKGTATFSDLANQIAGQRGFWLDDAFASGGSVGYDHKKMGITARGAWESAKRHFRELGKDIQSENFTCTGVGDMSGDVFGNGMLLSPHIQLVAAFNHLHIFVDPAPDAATSFAERNRLFELQGSNWTDYNPRLISDGGGVFDRSAKQIEPTAEIAQLLDIDTIPLTPNELIQAILKAQVELLFFGGIGTYVKASHESDADAGDRSNDALRINATEVRAQVVVEGANLGLTQQARVQYSLEGGLCNTDFIDNCAGVDCSDHEVNIKILLGEAERSKQLTRPERNQLLEEMTDEVAKLVLRNAYEQTQSLSVTQNLGSYLTERIARFMRALEKSAGLDRSLEFLPSDETLEDRAQRQIGFSRPELCVLTSHAKNRLFRQLAKDPELDDPFLIRDLVDYFPVPLRDRFRPIIERHRLRREIVATILANEIINRVGITFLFEVSEQGDTTAGRVAAAYVIARELHRLPELWRQVEALDNHVQASVQYEMLAQAGRLATATTQWLLGTRGGSSIGERLNRFASPAASLADQLDEALSSSDRLQVEAATVELTERGVPQALAARVARLPLLSSTCDIVDISHQTGHPVQHVARWYFELGSYFGFEWLRDAARRVQATRRWDKHAIASITQDLYAGQRLATLALIQQVDHLPTETGVVHAIRGWGELHPRGEHVTRVISEVQAHSSPDVAMLSVAARELGCLAKVESTT